jgi:hypothetical protein
MSDLAESAESSVAAGDRRPGQPFRLNYNFDYQNIVDGLFLARLLEEQLTTIRGDSWITSADFETAPGEVLAEASYFHASRYESLIRLDAAVAHLILRDLALTVRVAAIDATTCAAALAQSRR